MDSVLSPPSNRTLEGKPRFGGVFFCLGFLVPTDCEGGRDGMRERPVRTRQRCVPASGISLNLPSDRRDYFTSGGTRLMQHVRVCRQFALQCFRWATKQDASHQQAFIDTARAWLKTAQRLEKSDEASARVAFRARLH